MCFFESLLYTQLLQLKEDDQPNDPHTIQTQFVIHKS